MRTVNVAELKNRLSWFLRQVRTGEELLVRDRQVPIAKIVPLRNEEIELDELSLVASGQMTLPRREFNADRFWSIGARSAQSRNLKTAIRRAVEAEREEGNARILGRKRHHPRQASNKAKSLVREQPPVVWWATPVEVRSALLEA